MRTADLQIVQLVKYS